AGKLARPPAATLLPGEDSGSLLPSAEALPGRLLEGGPALRAVAREARVLHQEHQHEPPLRVDHHAGRVGAALAKGVAARGPAQAVARLDRVAGLLARHRLDRRLREVALPPEDAVAQDHLAEAPHVVGGREQAAGGDRLPPALVQRIFELRD